MNPPRIRRAQPGDIVTIDLQLTPQDGFVPEPLFDAQGIITFVLGAGNYLPAIHELVKGCVKGDVVSDMTIDAGWGGRRKEWVVTVPRSQLPADLVAGETTLRLKGGWQVLVIEVHEDTVVLDANPPLAGSSYRCDFTVLAVEPGLVTMDATAEQSSCYIQTRQQPPQAQTLQSSEKYQMASFALGCFWGAELAFMRVPGVVGTRVGYSQGRTQHPTHEEVSAGRTRHREAVLVIYDATIVSYQQLVQVATQRWREWQHPMAAASQNVDDDEAVDDDYGDALTDLFREDGVDHLQYQSGIYYHNEEQREIAQAWLTENPRLRFELKAATIFYEAEENHQQYLYKGGQSARKNAKEKIRCFG